MREVLYWPRCERLIYLDEGATPEFWDAHWEHEGVPPPVDPRDYVITVTRRYVAPNARVLEGGCGRANKVKALAYAGYDAIGVDFAEGTVREARRTYSGIDIRKGDVRALDFSDGYFDGYWSIGVIEHFWNGYDAILSEAARVLKPGGFLFLSAPWFSPYRKSKARAGDYAIVDPSEKPESFYQFALGREEISAQTIRHGFELQAWHGWVSEISLREDATRFQRPIEWLLDSRASLARRAIGRATARALDPYCGHSFLAVARRNR